MAGRFEIVLVKQDEETVLDIHTRNPGAQNQRDKGEEDSYRNHPPCLFDFHTHKVDGDGIE